MRAKRQASASAPPSLADTPSRPPRAAYRGLWWQAHRTVFSITAALVLLAATIGGTAVYFETQHAGSTQQGQSVRNTPQVIGIGTSTYISCGSPTATTCNIASVSVAAYSALVIFVLGHGTTAPSAVAVHGYTPALVKAETAGTGTQGLWSYLINNMTAASVTVYANFTAGIGYLIMVVDLTNVQTSALDVSNDAVGNSSSPSSSCTTTVANDQVVGAAMELTYNGNMALEVGSGNTLIKGPEVDAQTPGTESITAHALVAVAGPFASAFLEYKVVSGGSGTTNPWSAMCVALKPAAVPGAPSSLATGAITTTSIAMTWSNPNSGVGPLVNTTVYQATYTGGSCGAYTMHYSLGARATSYTVTGLTISTYYCFEITVWNSTGQSAFSNILSDVETAAVPLAPTGVSATPESGTTDTVLIMWTEPAGTLLNNSYNQYNASSCSGAAAHVGPPPLYDVSLGVTTLAVVSGLTAGTAYSWTVSGWNATGEGAEASCVTATTYKLASAPSGLGATGVTTTQATLNWAQPSGGVINDTIYEGVTCGTWTAQISAGAVSSYTVTGLNPGATYCFTVSAWTGGGDGPLANPYLNVTAVNSLPTRVTNLHATGIGITNLTLRWIQATSGSGSIVNNTVYYGAVCGTWAAKLSTGTPKTSYDLTGLSGSSTYCLAVGAWNAGGQGPLNYTNATTSNGVPSAVSGLTLISASQHYISFLWTNPSGTLVNNTVNYTTTAACAGGLTQVSTGGATASWTVGGLLAFTTYYVEVSAWSSGGQGASSSCVAMITQSATPPAPIINVGQTTVGQTYINLVWINPAGYTLFNNSVYYGTSCGVGYPTFSGWGHIVNTHGVTSQWNVTSLATSTSYCFGVTAWDGQSNLSVTANFSTGNNSVFCITNCTIVGPSPASPLNATDELLLGLGALFSFVALIGFFLVYKRRKRGGGEHVSRADQIIEIRIVGGNK